MSATEEIEKNKKFIIERLKNGPTYRKDLHLECCKKLGKSLIPSTKPSRICEDMPDNHFDRAIEELLDSKTVKKMGNLKGKGNFMFYGLVENPK